MPTLCPHGNTEGGAPGRGCRRVGGVRLGRYGCGQHQAQPAPAHALTVRPETLAAGPAKRACPQVVGFAVCSLRGGCRKLQCQPSLNLEHTPRVLPRVPLRCWVRTEAARAPSPPAPNILQNRLWAGTRSYLKRDLGIPFPRTQTRCEQHQRAKVCRALVLLPTHPSQGRPLQPASQPPKVLRHLSTGGALGPGPPGATDPGGEGRGRLGGPGHARS